MDSSIVEFLIMVAVIVAPMILKNLFKGGVDADDIFYPPEKKPPVPTLGPGYPPSWRA